MHAIEITTQKNRFSVDKNFRFGCRHFPEAELDFTGIVYFLFIPYRNFQLIQMGSDIIP